MRQRTLLFTRATALFAGIAGLSIAQPKAPFSVLEAGIPEMRAAMEQKRATSRELVTQYLVRIEL